MPATKLSDSHRYFLQTFTSRSILNEADTVQLFVDSSRQFNDRDPSVAQFPSFLKDINSRLQPLSLEIRRGTDEEHGKIFFALVNLHQDEAAKLATDFDAKEIGYFKKVMDLIIAADDGVCSSVELVNAGAELQPHVGVSEATSLLERLAQDEWLSNNKDEGYLFLGARTMIELLPHLRDVYGDAVVDCHLCSNIVVKGQRCTSCETKLHVHCAARFMSGREPQCPSCQTPWAHIIPDIPHDAHHPAVQNGGHNGVATPVPGPTSHGRRSAAASAATSNSGASSQSPALFATSSSQSSGRPARTRRR
ncbi:non-structural maintenance of chromosomes element 1 homolog [Sycon ciliatum]|uniref:non-structural maintenance of chromosomes element 1 homolog n=1 Tax=Sycon ciliatum TaxID=27933 RepID=UPI0031F6F771